MKKQLFFAVSIFFIIACKNDPIQNPPVDETPIPITTQVPTPIPIPISTEKPIVVKEDSQIPFEILNEIVLPNKVSLYIYVDPEYTQSEILALGAYFRDVKYENVSTLYIAIFDSKEAYENRNKVPIYSESTFKRYFLIQYIRNPETRLDKLTWIGVGRGN